MASSRLGKLDTVSIAGIAVFGAMATFLAVISQGLGLNFPVLPYLQFDLGEVPILLSFFIFGPLSGVVASFVEFVALMEYGQNVPVGPVIKLAALLSTLVGLYVGTLLVSRIRRMGAGRTLGSAFAGGLLTRLASMTVANYYLVLFFYGLSATLSYYQLGKAFSIIGIAITPDNAVLLILMFTGIFNALQLVFTMLLSYVILRFRSVSNVRFAGRGIWIASQYKQD